MISNYNLLLLNPSISFDPEPKRYIHCVKLEDTCAPYPLLSEAVKTWQGPTKTEILSSTNRTENDTCTDERQSAGQTTLSNAREFPTNDEERIPLKLAPRTIPSGLTAPPGAIFEFEESYPASAISGANKNLISESQQAAPRFAPLLAERERVKLNLNPRTIPLELPPFQQASSAQEAHEAFEIARKKREEKEQREAQRKKTILAAAFASDDEDEEDDDDRDSVWEDSDSLYSGDDLE